MGVAQQPTVAALTGVPLTFYSFDSPMGTGVPSPVVGNGGSAVRNNGVPMSAHILQVNPFIGAATQGTIQLQGSLDGVTWYNLGSPITPRSSLVKVIVVDQLAVYLQPLITVAFLGVAAINVYMNSAGK